MASKRIEKLRQEYTGARVLTEFRKPQFAQLTNRRGRVWTINCNGRALVQFDGADAGWHDIEIDFLKVIDEPKPATAEEEGTTAPAKKPASQASPPSPEEGTVELSRLEVARAEKKAKDEAEAAMASSEAAE